MLSVQWVGLILLSHSGNLVMIQPSQWNQCGYTDVEEGERFKAVSVR